ncbi:MAG: hypothetical protein JWQ53_1419 [Klenkia sp.]|nr:hypothetical protein [Klenkia sp.]
MRRAALLGTLAVLLAAGCGAEAPAFSAPSLPPVDGLTGEVVRLRTDEAVGGQVQVRLTATEPLTVTALALQSPAFAGRPATAEATDYRPGQTIDLPVPFGAVDCARPVEPVAARVTVTRGGVSEDLVVPLAGDALATVAAEECAVAQFAAAVTLEVRGLTDGPDDVRGDVVLTRVTGHDEDVVVTALGRSVLLEPVTPTDLPATLGDDELVLPLRITLATCESHVLAEAKKPFAFPLRVQVGETEAVPDLPLSDAQRAQLQELVDRVCR